MAAAQRERSEEAPLVSVEAPLVNGEEQPPFDTSRSWLWSLRRSRIIKVAAVSLLGALCVLVAAMSVPGKPRRMVVDNKADAAAVTGLDVVQGGRMVLEVGTSTQAFAQTASSVTASFLVGGVWTSAEELFPSSQEGEVHTLSAFVSQWPTAVRLKINGNDGWGYKFVRISFLGVERSLLESVNGKPYGDNEFWLDGNQKLQSARVFPVPRPARRPNSSNPTMRWLLLLLFLLIVAGIAAYYFRDHIRKYLAVLSQAPPTAALGPVAMQGGPLPMASQQGLLAATPMDVSAQGLQSQQMVR